MQRLFSAFLQGWPGAGLLLLRLTLATGLCFDAATRLHGSAPSQILPALAGLLAAAMLVIGLWTPIAGSVVCLLQFGIALTTDGALEPPLQRAVLGLCLALLGPGAWSIDARLFGRRRVEIKHLGDN